MTGDGSVAPQKIGRLVLLSGAIVLACGAISAARPAAAQACQVMKTGPSTWQCGPIAEMLGSNGLPPCPSHADGGITFEFFNFIGAWAQGVNSTLTFGGSAVGSSNSPCPNSTAGVIFVHNSSNPMGVPPSGDESEEADMTITPGLSATGGETPTVFFTNTFSGVPAACITPMPLPFGYRYVGQPLTQTFTITNCGHADLTIGALSILSNPPGGFSLTADGCSNQTLSPSPPGNVCTTGVTFGAPVTGAFSGQVMIPSNGTGNPQLLLLSGTASPELQTNQFPLLPPLMGGPFGSPAAGTAFDANADLFLADPNGISVYDPSGNYRRTIVNSQFGAAGAQIGGLVIGPSNDAFVPLTIPGANPPATQSTTIYHYDANGNLIGADNLPQKGPLGGGIYAPSNGFAFVDGADGSILRSTDGGQTWNPVVPAGGLPSTADGIAVDSLGNAYVTNRTQILRFDSAFQNRTTLPLPSQFTDVRGIRILDQSHVLISDFSHNLIGACGTLQFGSSCVQIPSTGANDQGPSFDPAWMSIDPCGQFWVPIQGSNEIDVFGGGPFQTPGSCLPTPAKPNVGLGPQLMVALHPKLFVDKHVRDWGGHEITKAKQGDLVQFEFDIANLGTGPADTPRLTDNTGKNDIEILFGPRCTGSNAGFDCRLDPIPPGSAPPGAHGPNTRRVVVTARILRSGVLHDQAAVFDVLNTSESSSFDLTVAPTSGPLLGAASVAVGPNGKATVPATSPAPIDIVGDIAPGPAGPPAEVMSVHSAHAAAAYGQVASAVSLGRVSGHLRGKRKPGKLRLTLSPKGRKLLRRQRQLVVQLAGSARGKHGSRRFSTLLVLTSR